MKKQRIILNNIATINANILSDLTARNLVNFGYQNGDAVYIEKLKDNKPATIKAHADELAEREPNAKTLYIIEIDKEKANAKRFYTCKYLKYCGMYDGEARSINKVFNYHYSDFKYLDNCYRVADYHKARVYALNIYCVYFKNHADEMKRKHDERDALKDGYYLENNDRFNNIAIDFIYYRASGSPVYSEAVSKRVNKITAISTLLNRAYNIHYYYYGNIKNIVSEYLSTNTTSDEVKNALFDKNGYFIFNRLQTLKKRASELKEKREKARVLSNDFATEKSTLNALKSDLIKSLNELNAFFINYAKTNGKINEFYYIHRLEPTARKIARAGELIREAEQKKPASITDFLNTINKFKDGVKETLFLNKCYLDLTDDERAKDNGESETLTAIYYNDLKHDADGLKLDIERARERLNSRGY